MRMTYQKNNVYLYKCTGCSNDLELKASVHLKTRGKPELGFVCVLCRSMGTEYELIPIEKRETLECDGMIRVY